MIFPLLAAAVLFSDAAVKEAFGPREGALVIKDVQSGETFRFNPKLAEKKLPPCSTFKIWNTAIGLETGKIAGADDPFWKWDGQKYEIEAWNADQTLRSAFAASCVPAYQALARKIGQETMDTWLAKIGYGDRNTSSGIDVFWLPAPGRKPLLISVDEQADLMVRLAKDGAGFSQRTREVLKDVMTARKSPRGTLYGKTGTSSRDESGNRIGWYVGYFESGGNTCAFASLIVGPDVMGKDARAVVERVFEQQKLLGD